MSISYFIDNANELVVCEASGTLTVDTVNKLRVDLMEDPEFTADMSLLFDMHAVKEFEIAPSEFEQIAADSVMSKTSMRAYVTPTDDVFGMLRIFASYSNAEAERFQIFRDMGQARRWLGID